MRWLLWCFCLLAESYETINHYYYYYITVLVKQTHIQLLSEFGLTTCYEIVPVHTLKPKIAFH